MSVASGRLDVKKAGGMTNKEGAMTTHTTEAASVQHGGGELSTVAPARKTSTQRKGKGDFTYT